MKKILISIAVIVVLSIIAFVIYYPKARQNPVVLYRSLVTETVKYKTLDNGNELYLDIMMPTSNISEKIPYIVYVHDGDFTNGDKQNMFDEVNYNIVYSLLNRGYAIISVNYRLLGANTHFPDNLIDVGDAMKFLYKNSETIIDRDKYVRAVSLDTSNVGIWGTGSGAFIALNVAYMPSGFYGGDQDLSGIDAPVDYAISFNGLTSVSNFTVNGMNDSELRNMQRRLDTLFGDIYDVNTLQEGDENYETMSIYNPVDHVSFDTVPTLIVTSLDDEDVDPSNSQMLAEELKHNLPALVVNDEYKYYYEFKDITHDLSDINPAIQAQIETPLFSLLEANQTTD